MFEPWKVELVQWYFNNPGKKHPNLKGRERSSEIAASPPQGDLPKSVPMNGVQDHVAGLSHNPGSPSVRVTRPKLVSKMKKLEGYF